MNKNKILSPNQIAIQRFKKNATGVISLVFILLCGIVALFAYFIIPDKTPYANTQILEISTQKPGFEVDMLLVPKQNSAEKKRIFRTNDERSAFLLPTNPFRLIKDRQRKNRRLYFQSRQNGYHQ